MGECWASIACKSGDARDFKRRGRNSSTEVSAETKTPGRSRSWSRDSLKSVCSGCMFNMDWAADHESLAQKVALLNEADDSCPADEVFLRSMRLRVSPVS